MTEIHKFKNKNNNLRIRFKSFVVYFAKLLAALCIIAMCGLSLFAYWAWGGYVKPSLDGEYIPTAQYLLEHPEESLLDDPWFSFQVQTNEKYTTSDGLCFDVTSMDMEDFTNLIWSEVYVNEQIVSRFHWNWPGFVYYTMPGHSVVCINAILNSGIHIIEFRAKKSAFSSPYYIRKWAIEIE